LARISGNRINGLHVVYAQQVFSDDSGKGLDLVTVSGKAGGLTPDKAIIGCGYHLMTHWRLCAHIKDTYLIIGS
jgi:hypothetical protein